MDKKKIKIIKRQFREIKRPSFREVTKEEEESRGIGNADSDEEEKQESEDEFSDDFSAAERKAPMLEQTGAKQEELEGMLSGVETKGKGEAKEEKKEDFKYELEKPKYSFSNVDEDRDIDEIRHVVLRETPSLIEKTHEAREIHNTRINEPMFEHHSDEEYVIRNFEANRQEVLEESQEIKGKKTDIKKYRKER